jgi:DNA mismatch endonuclease (patch repair protein)
MRPPKPLDPKRSALMARVRQRGTSGELAVARQLRTLGAAYRTNVRNLAGSPDFANKKRRWAVFVQGCYWHHHTACGRATIPRANRDFWQDKFSANRKRDARAVRALRSAGFRVVLVWECEVADAGRLRGKLSKIFEPRGVDVRKAIDH